jgi:predicted enzyme related to lactoylglutathione lyase
MLAHTELASTDPGATKEFLNRVFRWELDEVDTPTGKLVRYRTPGGAEGSIRKTKLKESPGTVNYILVDDLEAMETKIEKMGGEIIMPAVDVPHMGRFFWFKVPGGPVLAAWQDAPDRKG